jgi:hypothetical protein
VKIVDLAENIIKKNLRFIVPNLSARLKKYIFHLRFSLLFALFFSAFYTRIFSTESRTYGHNIMYRNRRRIRCLCNRLTVFCNRKPVFLTSHGVIIPDIYGSYVINLTCLDAVGKKTWEKRRKTGSFQCENKRKMFTFFNQTL